MKKCLAVLFSMMLFSPAVFAELSSFDVKETIKEYSGLTREFMKSQIGQFGITGQDLTYFDEDYTTKQYIPNESESGEDYDGTKPVSEERTSKGYYELVIKLSTKEGPADPVTYESFGFFNYGYIWLNINGKDVRFKLDCTVVSRKTGEPITLKYNEKGEPIITEDAIITLRYPKKYFTLAKQLLSYNPINIKSKFRYSKEKGKKEKITLNAKIYETLVIESWGFEVYFVLEPNLKDIYKDFEFVRE